jgi:hypothetical protein
MSWDRCNRQGWGHRTSLDRCSSTMVSSSGLWINLTFVTEKINIQQEPAEYLFRRRLPAASCAPASADVRHLTSHVPCASVHDGLRLAPRGGHHHGGSERGTHAIRGTTRPAPWEFHLRRCRWPGAYQVRRSPCRLHSPATRIGRPRGIDRRVHPSSLRGSSGHSCSRSASGASFRLLAAKYLHSSTPYLLVIHCRARKDPSRSLAGTSALATRRAGSGCPGPPDPDPDQDPRPCLPRARQGGREDSSSAARGTTQSLSKGAPLPPGTFPLRAQLCCELAQELLLFAR